MDTALDVVQTEYPHNRREDPLLEMPSLAELGRMAQIPGADRHDCVQSFVNDIIMPIPGAILGRLDFSNFLISLNGTSYPTLAAAKAAGAPTINYGLFINTLINFLIVALVVFFLVRAINHLRRQAEGAPEKGPKDKECPFCHTQIPIKAVRCPNCTSALTHMPEVVNTI